MGTRYVRRESGEIVSSSKNRNRRHTEKIDDTNNPEWDAFVAKQDDRRENPPAPPRPPYVPPASGNSVPALRTDVNRLWQACVDAGIISDSS